MKRAYRSSSTLSISSTACGACCVSFCRRSRRSDRSLGAHDPDPHRHPVALSAARHLDADRDELCGFSHPEQHELVGARTLPCPLRTDPSPLLRSRRRREARPCARRLSPFPYDDVPARWLASHHLQHVDALAVRTNDRGSTGSWPLSRLLCRLWH